MRKNTSPVGSFPAGASPYGCLDVEGNVYQWCADYCDLDYLKSAPSANPTGPPSGFGRVLRGGPWFLGAPNYFRRLFAPAATPVIRDTISGSGRLGWVLRRRRTNRSDAFLTSPPAPLLQRGVTELEILFGVRDGYASGAFCPRARFVFCARLGHWRASQESALANTSLTPPSRQGMKPS